MPDIPPELILLIARHLQAQHHLATLSRLHQSSWSTYHLVSPLLYEHVELTYNNAGGVFVGLLADKDGGNGRDMREEGGGEGTVGDEVRDQWSLWPSVPIRLPSDTAPIPSTLSPSDYTPSSTSHTRKLRLLSHTTSLTITSLPAPPLARSLLPLFPARTKVPLPVFPHLQHITVGTGFILDLAEYLSRLWAGSPRSSTAFPHHPVIDFLLLSTPPHLQTLTWSYPPLTSELKSEWVATRWGAPGVVRRCGLGGTRKRQMEREWRLFVEEICGMGLMPLTFHWKPRAGAPGGGGEGGGGNNGVMRFKRVVCGAVPLPRSGVVRVEYEGCDCRKRSRAGEDDEEEECANHVDVEMRTNQILELINPTYDAAYAASALDVEKWVFVDAELRRGGDGDARGLGVEERVKARLEGTGRGENVIFETTSVPQ
ncbi:hypothetical protein IAT38_000465 [Cryptococcus sp. DSM 104549]